jgi:diacylglycerol kinase (ATP)
VSQTTSSPPIPVIWNAEAGKRALSINKLDEPGLRAVLEKAGLAVDIFAPGSAEETKAKAKELVAGGARTVIAAGGDGTTGLIAEALLDTDVALGIVPLGSVMNIPRMLNIPREPEAAAQIIAAGITRLIDVGVANGTLFYETASVGIGAAIFRESDRFEHGDYGTLFRAVRNAFRYRPARMSIELADRRRINSRALMVTVGNGPYMGLGMTVAPAARPDDGLLDIRVFRHFSKFELLRHFVGIAYGRYRYSPHVLTERSRSVRIEGSRPLPVRADAKSLGYTPLECEVRPQALKVIVPGTESGATVR